MPRRSPPARFPEGSPGRAAEEALARGRTENLSPAALFAVCAGAGVRIGEAIALPTAAIEAAERSPRLRVLGKGNKPRVIPVGPEVVATIDDYLPTRAERAGNPSPTDPLFIRRVQ